MTTANIFAHLSKFLDWDCLTTAKFGNTLSEPWEFSKPNYMTTDHFFVHNQNFWIPNGWLRDYSQIWQDPIWLIFSRINQNFWILNGWLQDYSQILRDPIRTQGIYIIWLHDYGSFFRASIKYFGLRLADYMTIAKSGVSPSEPGEFQKFDYMTTANIFALLSKFLD